MPSPLVALIAGGFVGLYAMAPGVELGGLAVRRGLEIVDHVAPGLVVLVMVCVASRRRASPLTMMITGAFVVLAGLWMVATHVGLLRQGIDHQVPWGPVAYHCSTAVGVLALGLSWVFRYRRALSI